MAHLNSLISDVLDMLQLYWRELGPVILLAAIAWLSLFVKERRSLLEDIREEARDLLPPTPRLSTPAPKGFRRTVVPFARTFGTSREQWDEIERRRLSAICGPWSDGKGAA